MKTVGILLYGAFVSALGWFAVRYAGGSNSVLAPFFLYFLVLIISSYAKERSERKAGVFIAHVVLLVGLWFIDHEDSFPLCLGIAIVSIPAISITLQGPATE